MSTPNAPTPSSSPSDVDLDREKVIVLDPWAREILGPWLDRDPESYCFVPAETSAWHYRRLRRRAFPR